jgi:hypothetical protein
MYPSVIPIVIAKGAVTVKPLKFPVGTMKEAELKFKARSELPGE